MEAVFIYLLKSALCTFLFFGVYWCFLRNETFYKFNRYFLLTGLVCSLAVPCYEYTYLVILEVPAAINSLGAAGVNNHFVLGQGLIKALFFIYLIIVCFLLFRHITGYIKIRNMVGKHGYTLYKGCKVITSATINTSFSVFNYIFIHVSDETSETEKNLILEHELAHKNQVHWLDLLIAQSVCTTQWFNPFAWLYMYFIKQNHEFLADKAVLQSGTSSAIYRAVLINHSLKTPVFMLASSFASFDRFKRINMMLRPTSNPVKKLTVLLVIPVLALLVLSFAKPKYLVTSQKKAYAPASVAVTEKEAKPNEKPLSSVSPAKSIPKRSARTSGSDSIRIRPKNILRLSSIDTAKSIGLVITVSPIILVDGVEQNMDIDSLDPNDIASISVFKGENAVAKFGSRGANGVILVTTKKAVTEKF